MRRPGLVPDVSHHAQAAAGDAGGKSQTYSVEPAQIVGNSRNGRTTREFARRARVKASRKTNQKRSSRAVVAQTVAEAAVVEDVEESL